MGEGGDEIKDSRAVNGAEAWDEGGGWPRNG